MKITILKRVKTKRTVNFKHFGEFILYAPFGVVRLV